MPCFEWYRWRVRATDGAGNTGAWSNESLFSVARFIITPTPTYTPTPTPTHTPTDTPTLTPSLPDLVTGLMTTGSATIVNDGLVRLPLSVGVMNLGGTAADIFKVSTVYGDADDMHVVPFTVPGQDDIWHPYTNAPLAAASLVFFDGVVTFRAHLQGETVSLWATADSCAGDEFMLGYCRVEESNEGNNHSTSISISLPELITVELTPVADAYIHSSRPTNNYGSERLLIAGTGDGTGVHTRSLINFNLSSIPTGAMIQDATLLVYLADWSGDTSETDIGVAQVYVEWTEAEVNWINQPATSWPDFVASTLVDGYSRRYYRWDVTSLVQDWVNGMSNYGLMLVGDESVRAAYFFYSREYGEVPPRLGIQYITVP